MSERNFFYLLAGLLLLLVAAPLDSALFGDQGGILLESAFIGLLLVGLWSVHRTSRLFVASLVLGVLAVWLIILGITRANELLLLAAQGLVLLFCVLMVGAATKQVFFTPGVDTNTVVGAVCIYLLLGIIWAICYRYVETFVPGSIAGLTNDSTRTQALVYYSFVTLTTLGYGDITPVSPLARTLALLEAIIGQLYLAVVVAGLVGAHVATRGHNQRNTNQERET